MYRIYFRIVLFVAFTIVFGNPQPASGLTAAAAVQDQNASNPQGILEATKFHGSLMGMQYETWFTPKNATWDTAEAVPIFSKYSSYNVGVMRKHAEWFRDLGIDWLLIDWSNMLWMKPQWEQHAGATHELEETTELLLKTYSQMNKEGKSTPKIVLLLGLENGDPVHDGMKRLNGIFAFLTRNYLSNPAYKNLWLYYHGKPLITILFNPADPCETLPDREKPVALDAPQWTVRWMASQLQINHAEKCGMWSWMDGSIRQLVTYHEHAAEETVVTPSCFAGGGWLATSATGRDHGAPYIESWKVAFETRPKFIQIHQWNEFAGQKEGEGFGADHRGYVDEYNLESSDDIEPTRLHGCAYRGCGGWGYYYLNLTKALIALYRGATPDITVMTLSGPNQPAVVREGVLPLRWEILGKQPASFTVQLDGKVVADHLQGQGYPLTLTGITHGKHRVTVTADGAHTYFSLSPAALASRSGKPLPVSSTIDFTYSPAADKK